MGTKKHEELRELVGKMLMARAHGTREEFDDSIAKIAEHMNEDYYTQKPTVDDVVNVLESNINNVLFEPSEVVKKIARWHRTLQQSFTSLCFCWIAHIAQYRDHEYDLRNQAGVLAARRIKSFCDEHDIYLGGLPSI